MGVCDMRIRVLDERSDNFSVSHSIRWENIMDTNICRHRKIISGLFAFLVFGGLGQAQVTNEASLPRTLPVMIVTGTRLQKAPLEQPYAYYRTTEENLETMIGRTILDRFNYGPGVFIQRTAPNQASPFIRGLTGEQTLLLLDGVRFNHAMMRPGPNQYSALIPEVSVTALDSILGSSSTVNGSDGLTGAIDYRLAPAGRGVKSAASPWVESRVDSGNGGTLQIGSDGIINNWAYSIELSGSMFHDRVGGKDFRNRVFAADKNAYNTIPNTAYDAAAAGFRLAYLGAEDHFFELSAGHSRQLDARRPDGYFENTAKKDSIYRFFDPQALSYVHLRDHWSIDAPLARQIQTTLWWHQFAEKQFRSSRRNADTPAEYIRRREYDDALNAYGGDLQITTMLGSDQQHEITWGGTFIYEITANKYRELRTPVGSTELSLLQPYNPENWPNNTTVSDDSTYTTLGFFVQDDWSIFEHFSLLSGLRYSRYDWSFGSVNGNTDDFTGSVRGIWETTLHHSLFAGISKGFRAPNLTNLDGLSDRGSSGNPAQGNPDLSSEISYTYEAGWNWRQRRNYFALTAFKTDIEDLIQRDFAGSGEFTNVEGADIHGLESAWDYGMNLGDMRRLAIVGAVSLVDATRDIPLAEGGTVKDNLSRANRLYGRIGLKYEHNRNWWGLTQVRWHDEYDDVAVHPADADADDVRLTIAGDSDGSMPGYAVTDVMLGWQTDDKLRRVGFFVENIADKTYREPGSGTDGVGRSIGVTVAVRL